MSFKKFKITGRFIRQSLGSKSPRIAYVAGWNGHQNLGDEALYDALKYLFSPAGFIDYPGGLKWKFALKMLPHLQMALLAGGTLISGKASTLETAKKCFDLCPHPVVFGTGAGHPSLWVDYLRLSRWRDGLQQWKEVLQKCEYVGVRGPMSAEVIGSLGFDKVEIIGDPVLALAEEQIPKVELQKTPCLGINIGQAKGDMWGELNNICEQYVKLACMAKKAGWQVKWFVVWSGDIAVTNQVALASNTSGSIYKIYKDWHRYLDLVKSLNVFVGMKLHSVALATCVYVPSIMLEYQPKCRDYMMSIGQEHVTIRTDHLEGENVWEMIQTLSGQRQRISESLYRTIQPLRQKQFHRAAELMKKICYE